MGQHSYLFRLNCEFYIRDHGGTEALISRMPTRAELYETIGYYDYEALDEGIAKSVVPETPGE